jgi:hypothetical protein
MEKNIPGQTSSMSETACSALVLPIQGEIIKKHLDEFI